MFALSNGNNKATLPHTHHRQYSRDRSNSAAFAPSSAVDVLPSAVTAAIPTTTVAAPPTKTPPGSGHVHRFSSRSNSVSSLRRSTSLTSKFAHTPSGSADLTAADPARIGPAKLQKRFPGSNGSSRASRRHSSVAHIEGIGSWSRASHSASSSKSSVKDVLNGTGSASANPLHGPLGRRPSSPDLVRTPSPKRGTFGRHRSPIPSPEERRSHLPAVLPPLPLPSEDTLQFLTSAVYDPNESTSSATTPTNAHPPPQPSASGTLINLHFDHGPPLAPPPSRPPPDPASRRTASDANAHLFTQTRPHPSVQPPAADADAHPPLTRQTSAPESFASQRLGAPASRERSRSPSVPPVLGRRERDKKTMLSRALQKANTAVVLDNAQNFEGAIEAYEDACKLLRQVMQKTSNDEDRRKLDAIRITYTSRIRELKNDPSLRIVGGGKSLPARPMSDESLPADPHAFMAEVLDSDDQADDEPVLIETATMTRIVNDPSANIPQPRGPPPSARLPPPPTFRRESAVTAAMREVANEMPTGGGAERFLRVQSPPGVTPLHEGRVMTPLGVESPMDREYMPPPLSPRRPLTPRDEKGADAPKPHLPPQSTTHNAQFHDPGQSEDSISWLDTVDESPGSSRASSVHSVSDRGIKRKHLRTASGETEAEFDAALDAAVEAAYDDGFEPYEDAEAEPVPRADTYTDAVATVRRNIELAKEKIREIEREEAIREAHRRERQRQHSNASSFPHVRDSGHVYPDDVDEEERILDEMTREYMLDGFDFGLQSKSALPRQSDASDYSNKTWHSSVSSKRTTGGTSLSTVSESTVTDASERSSHHGGGARGAGMGQMNMLPPVSEANSLHGEPLEAPGDARNGALEPPAPDASIQERRKSAQNVKGLTIETAGVPASVHGYAPDATKPEPSPYGPRTSSRLPPSASGFPRQPPLTAPPTTLHIPSPNLGASQSEHSAVTASPATPFLAQVATNDMVAAPPSPPSKFPGRLPGGLKKNKSSVSLKNRAMSLSSPDDGSDGSPGTPVSATFAGFTTQHARKATLDASSSGVPVLPPFPPESVLTGGIHLFESDIHSPYSPGTPNPMALNAPIPLEPCPDAYLLRPFWLMRCFYQTIAHPRGGYLSTKLFVPRDVWRVKGVKIKAVDEKIANCDLLTAALLKLGAVDTFDSDAVLEEMQSLELVLDQVQANLVKKLGSDVGVSGVAALWKDVPVIDDSAIPPVPGLPPSKSNSVSHHSKSYLSSWRKLRSKGSGSASMGPGGFASGGGPISVTPSRDPPRDGLILPTVPMTSLPNPRFAKRDVRAVDFGGPHAQYAAALARLFDAAQVVDQVARQVEDPGLRHSNSTYVGLELCARHAAEFFGFYVCRFVLADLSVFLDKFVKRGSEWVLV